MHQANKNIEVLTPQKIQHAKFYQKEQKNDKGLAAAAYDESPHQHEIACNAYALLIIKVFKKVLKVLKRLKALLK